MNAELAALLAAAKSTPEDDAPRLVMADWLDEHGEPDRARLVRLQCHPDYRWDGAGAALRAEADAIAKLHGPRWWGHSHPGMHVWPRRGLLAVRVHHPLPEAELLPALLAAWRQGWVAELEVSTRGFADFLGWPLLESIAELHPERGDPEFNPVFGCLRCVYRARFEEGGSFPPRGV